MDHFLFSSKQCNNAPRCELSSAHKQPAMLESLEKSRTHISSWKLCNVGFVYVLYA